MGGRSRTCMKDEDTTATILYQEQMSLGQVKLSNLALSYEPYSCLLGQLGLRVILLLFYPFPMVCFDVLFCTAFSMCLAVAREATSPIIYTSSPKRVKFLFKILLKILRLEVRQWHLADEGLESTSWKAGRFHDHPLSMTASELENCPGTVLNRARWPSCSFFLAEWVRCGENNDAELEV